MRFRTYDRIEEQILNSDKGAIRLRIKWGAMVLNDDRRAHPDGRLKKGAIDWLIANAAKKRRKLSRTEVQYRVQAARTYRTEAEITQLVGQFQTWKELIQARFPTVDVAEDEGLFDAPGDASQSQSEPYDPRAPHEKRDQAVRQLKRVLDSPEANGQPPLPGMPGLRIYLPGFTSDTVGPETVFRVALQIHEDIKTANAQVHNASDQLKREDDEREEKLYRMFDATGRNLEASLRDGDNALLGAESPAVQ